MNALYFALAGAGMLLTGIGIVAWRFRRTLPLDDYKKKYDDL